MIKTLRIAIIFTLLLLCMPVQKAYSKGMNIFLDVSNSYEGADKFETLKDGVIGFIKENPGLDVKVTLFGYPLHGRNEKIFQRMFKEMWRKGMIKGIRRAESLENVLSSLKPDREINVVISGGKGDWYRIKGALREKNALKLYVIGVSLPGSELMYKLLGIASVSGGEYFNAGNASRLKDVLYDIEKKANYNLEVKVFKSKYHELTDYLMWRYRYLWTSEVYPAGEDEKSPIDSTYVFPARFNLPDGAYDIKIKYANEVKWLRGVNVKGRTLDTEEVNFAKGLLMVKVFNSGKPVEGVDKRFRYCWWSEAYEAGRHDRPVETTRTFPPEFNLVNGRYDIKIYYRGHEKWIYNVDINEGATENFTVTFPHAVECPAPAYTSASN